MLDTHFSLRELWKIYICDKMTNCVQFQILKNSLGKFICFSLTLLHFKQIYSMLLPVKSVVKSNHMINLIIRYYILCLKTRGTRYFILFLTQSGPAPVGYSTTIEMAMQHLENDFILEEVVLQLDLGSTNIGVAVLMLQFSYIGSECGGGSCCKNTMCVRLQPRNKFSRTNPAAQKFRFLPPLSKTATASQLYVVVVSTIQTDL